MDGAVWGFVVSCAVVFVAELGDKSQLMALAFATRYRALPVLVGITIATSLVHLVSVAVGHGLGAALPTDWIGLAAGIAFVGFGAWTLRGDSLSPRDEANARRGRGSAVAAVTVTFFLAELGDKTMLATITLATQHGWFGVWVGSTLGMVAADALAILAGRRLGRLLPERAVQLGAAALFFLFGAWITVDAAGRLTGRSAWDTLAAALDHHAAGWLALGLLVAVVTLGALGRQQVRAALRELPAGRPGGRAGTWARLLFWTAAAVGLSAPLLVGADLIQPVDVFVAPGLVLVGATVALLGFVLLLAAQVQPPGPGGLDPRVERGLYARVRNPGLTGMVVAMAGTLLMVPTLLAVLATVLLVAAAQVQARAVLEPRLSAAHGAAYAGYTARTGRFLPRVRIEDPAGAGLGPRQHARVG